MIKNILIKVTVLGVLMAGYLAIAHARPQNVQYKTAIAPVASTNTVTINPGGTGQQTCVDNLAVVSDSNATFRMLSVGTTTYQITLSSNVPHVNPFDANDPWCGVAGATVTFKVDTGNFTINYHGYKY